MPSAALVKLEDFPELEWSDIAPRLNAEVRIALEKVLASLDSAALSREEALALAHADGDDLLGLLVAANELRSELAGNLVTYIVNRNINFTNICFVGCKFCAFSRGPREADTYFLSLEQMAQKAREAWDLGATEVCIQGGLPRDLSPFYYRDILRAVKSAVPGMAATYGLRFAESPRIMDLGLLARALKEKQVDLVAGNTTDGLIPALDLAVLEDDKHYFPPYEAVAVMRQALVAKHPEVAAALAELAGKISDQDMQQLNYAVDGQHRDLKEVARDFLGKKGLGQ